METFRFLEVNDAAINLYGYSRKEFLDMDVLAIRREEDRDKFLQDNKDAADELRHAGMWTHLKKNKEEIQVLVFSRNIFYKDRQGRLILLMDVSEKNKIENELIKSEEKYRSLIEQASDGIILYSFDGTIHSFNKAAYAQTGYTREEFENLNLKDLFFESGIVKNRSADNKIKADKATTLYRKLKRKDGSVLVVELNARMLPDGKIFAIVRDITEREKTEAALKESEEKFSKAFHSNVLGFAIYDADFIIIDINNTYAAMLESDRKELLGKTSDDAGLISKVNIEKRSAISNQIGQILNEEKQLHNFEIEIETRKKELVTVLLSVEHMELNNKTYWLVSAIDITANKKADILLQERELKYRSLIEQASDGIIITDLKGNIQEVNQSIASMGGYDIKEMAGKHVQEFIPKEDIEANPFRFDELLEGGSLLHERRYLKKDGTFVDIEVNSKLTASNTLIGFIRDITERKLAAEAIKISEEKYRTLVDQASDGIFIADNAGRFLIVNPNGYAMSQYSEEALKKLTIYDLVLPEDIKKDPFHFAEMLNNKVARSERRMKRKDGSFLDVEVTAKFISGDRFLAFVRDISERKRAEEAIRKSNERFELIAQATNEAVWDHDFNKNETWGNKTHHSLYGYESETEKISFEMFLERIHPEERDGIAERLKIALSKSITSLSEEFRFKTANGEYRNFYDRAYIKYDENNRPLKMLGAMQDITDREIIRQQILKEKELSDSIINSLPGIFYLFTKEGKYLRWNKNFETVSGYTAEEISDMHPLNFFDKDDHELLTEKITNVFVSGKDFVELNFVSKSKQKFPYYFTGQAIQYEGQSCLMGVGIDISEKEKSERIIRESEERYKALVENAPEALVVMDINKQVFVNVSESATRLFKMSREELLKVGPVAVSPEYQPDGRLSSEAAMENIQKAIDGEKLSFEWIHCDKEGNPIPCEIWLVRLPSENELLIRGSIVDITERKKAAEEIRANSELLREL